MRKITTSILTTSLMLLTGIYAGCEKDSSASKKVPKETTKLIRAVADDETDWTWFVGTDGTKDTTSIELTTYFMKGIPSAVKHFQYFIDTDNNPNTGFSFGEDSWRISGADILIEDGDLYKSESPTEWKWSYLRSISYEKKKIEGLDQIQFDIDKSLLSLDSNIINVTIEPFDANWDSTYSTISMQAVTLVEDATHEDSDKDGFSNQEENIYGSDPLDQTSYPAIHVIDDNTKQTTLSKYDVTLDPKNTHDDTGLTYYPWTQGVSQLDHGFYVTTLNQREDSKDTYTIINILDHEGRSVGNAHLDYASHGQDLSVEKVSKNIYYLYSRSQDGHGIVQWKLDTSNINFTTPSYTDKELDIELSDEIEIDASIDYMTSSLNESKDKFISVGYIDSNNVKFHITDKETLSDLKSFTFNIDFADNGEYNQGIAMKGDQIYFLRGGSNNKEKRLFVFSAISGKLIHSYHFNFQKIEGLKRSEPEGIVIKNGSLFVCYNAQDAKSTRRIRLYKIIDL